VTNAEGGEVPTYLFDARPTIRHDGRESGYRLSYALEWELLALAAGGVMCAVAALAPRHASWRPQ
jgi:hypothetical protein